eukprot:scaffold7526_cov30-Tisochrysis_lutea.AAC.3
MSAKVRLGAHRRASGGYARFPATRAQNANGGQQTRSRLASSSACQRRKSSWACSVRSCSTLRARPRYLRAGCYRGDCYRC